MWKKMIIAVVMFVGTFSFAYGFYNWNMQATGNQYQAGGVISGRVNKSPNNLSMQDAGMKKGDRIMMATKNPYDSSQSLEWMLIKENTYTNYADQPITDPNNPIKYDNPEITSWYSMIFGSITQSRAGILQSDYIGAGGFSPATPSFMNANPLINILETVNDEISKNSYDSSFLINRDLTGIEKMSGWMLDCYKNWVYKDPFVYQKKVFIPEIMLEEWGGNLGYSAFTFTEPYMTSNFYYDNQGYQILSVSADGTLARIFNYMDGVDASGNRILSTLELPVRLAAHLNFDTVVFSTSQGTDYAIGEISSFELPSSYQSLYKEIQDEKGNFAMKLRVENPDLSSSTSLTQIENKNGLKITEAGKDSIIYLKANAKAGSNNLGVNTVSALVFDQNGKFVYYRPLENAKGDGVYTFDITGIPLGNYKIGIVNEVYDENSMDPTESSLITDVLPLEVIPGPTINYTEVYEGNPQIANTYEFMENVKTQNKIGSLTITNGIYPMTLHLSASSEPGHENDYQLFELSKSALESSETVSVNVLKNLDVGKYEFNIDVEDDNGLSNTHVVHLTVLQKLLDVGFKNPNQTNKSMKEAQTSWNETAIANPSNDTKITYSKTGGDISMIDIDSNTGAITYKGNNAFGKVTIRATVDDDPSTGKDNYNSAFTEKDIVIYRDVDGVLTPDSASSDINIPTFSMDKPNIKTGGTIGTIKGTLGTPDTIGGSTTTYSYAIKQDPNSDGSLFQLNANTGLIKANANLGVDTYQFVIVVSDKWSSKEIPVTVNVGMAPAENLKFYENQTSNTIINKKTVVLTDTGVNVYATVKGSTNNNPVTYKLKDGEPTNVIDVNPNSGAVTLKNVGTVVIVAEKQGSNGQANAIAELTFTVKAGSQEFIYTDAGGNELPKSGNDYDDYSEVYGKGKTFQLYTTGNPPGSTVTYALQAGSPTDVISVDPSGLVTIYNASLNTQIGQVIVEATSHDPSGNYTDKTIELPITITKADQTISFKNVTPAQSGQGKVTPIINAQDISSNEGGVTINDTNYYISVDSSVNGIAWTNNGIDIEYNYSGETTIEIPLHVEKAGNRNYNKAEADGKMRILSPDESNLSINQPGKIYYGDHFTLRSLQDDSSSTNAQYTFEVDNTIFVSDPMVNGNMAEFDALKCSSGTKVNIIVTRTADGEVTLSKVVTIEVLPKDINIIVDDKIKQKGEDNPPLTFQDFTSQLVSWNGVQDVVDSSIVKLSTTATKESKAGSYPITGNTREMNTIYPNYNFIFKEGKLMVDSNIDKDVDGDGKPDFNDPDGDGCPDLNIKWKDDDGNWIVINGDRDYDGIPDLNIDSDGDGLPDLNIDTDGDGLPDINLVILKKSDWKPTKCVTVNSTVKEEYCTGTNVKPQINVDTDNDHIPNINIDNNGDMKADLNISKDTKTPSVNIVDIHEWRPKHDYSQNSFHYDSIGTGPDEPKREINIDTDGDGRPDVNIDFDGDGKPDINIDMDGDEIPDIDIDTTGDGKPNINIDTNGDGKPDENIIEINEWKPNKDGDKNGQPFDTMEIEQKTELEDSGIKIEKPDGTPFLPNFAIRVEDVTDSEKGNIETNAKDIIKDKQEVKKVFDVKLLKDNVEVQPDGTLKIKIPYDEVTNPVLIRKNANGTYEKIKFTIENGYLTYETDELGIVSLIGDKEFETSVKGTYTPNIGGALTGDKTSIHQSLLMIFISFTIMMYVKRNKQKDTFQ